MTTKSMAYDNAAYEAVLGIPLGTLNGASAKSGKFCAFAACLIKSVTVCPIVVGSSAAQVLNLITLSGTATTTTAVATYGSAGTGTNTLTSTITMARGDVAWVTKGTDATDDFGVTLEIVLQPGASVTL